jgi:2',3'-cyclic-nucleotide 2'-phosphodiesterase (5'-nucleotidase family)
VLDLRAPSRLLLALLALALLAPVAGAGDDGEPEVRELTILHFNDLHARLAPDDRGRGGVARLAEAIRRERAGSPEALVLDAGDLITGTPVSTIYRGVPIYDIANKVGVDVSTLGNHEFDHGWEQVRGFRDEADFPIVSTNVVRDAGGWLADAPAVIEEVNGVRVAVIGVLTTDLPRLVRSRHIGPWRVTPVVDAVRARIAEIGDDADLMLVLGHLNEVEEAALLAEVPEMDLCVSGHPHGGLAEPKRVDGRLLVRVRSYGRELGRLDLKVDPERKVVVDWTWKAIPIDASIPEHPEVARTIASWETRVSEIVDVPIGRAARHFDTEEVRALVERAMVEQLDGVDLAYVNLGGIRDVIPAGPLLARQIWNVMPFDNRVVIGSFPGDRLPGFLARGKPVDPERTYRVATIDFLESVWKASGPQGLEFPEVGPDLRELIIAWVRKQEVLE